MSSSVDTFDATTTAPNFARFVVPIARVLFASIFLMAGLGHFSQQSIGYAASQGVPLANILVPLSGVLAILGGASILLGYKARLGGWAIVAFMIPVTVMMHKFWGISDPMAAQIQKVMFMKNVAITAGALLFTYFGAGPFSLDNRRA